MRAWILAAGLIAAASGAAAADYAAKGLRISQPWSRPAAQGGVGAGYLTITNTGKSADTLLRVETAAAASASLHTMTMNGPVMSMRQAAGLVIPPGRSVALAPGGAHIMLTGLKAPLKLGAKAPAVLVFQHAGRVPIEFQVQAAAPAAASHDHHH